MTIGLYIKTFSDWVHVFLFEIKQFNKNPQFSFFQKIQLAILKFIAIFSYFLGTRRTVKPHPEEEEIPTYFDEKKLIKIKRVWNDSNKPKVLVVSPCFVPDESSKILIKNLTKSLLTQTYKNFHILFIDDCSPISLKEYLEGCKTLWNKKKISVIRLEKNHGPAYGRNVGILLGKKLEVDYICFIDSDCEATKNWIETHISFQLQFKDKYLIVGGQTVPKGDTILDTYHRISGTLNGRKIRTQQNPKISGLLYAPTCNMSLNSKVIKTHSFRNIFPNPAFEDVEFCVNLRNANCKQIPPVVLYCGEAIVVHNFRTEKKHFITLCKLLSKQFFRYGSSQVIMLELHKQYLELLWSTDTIPCSVKINGKLTTKK